MNGKKRKTTVLAMAAVLSVMMIASPLAVMAEETAPAAPAITRDGNVQKETAPAIRLPENLRAKAGTALKDVALPEPWTWADDSTVIPAGTAEYLVRLCVDDTTYDYSKVEGYNAGGHYVERMVAVTAEAAKATNPVKGKPRGLPGAPPATYDVGDIEINADNFPDAEFQKWLRQQSYGTDGTITQADIADITRIDVSGKTEIQCLTGIEHFTALEILDCFGTGIRSLDVSSNEKLSSLWCNANASLTNLTVEGATALTDLRCYNTGIGSLDVSHNTELTNLSCDNTGIGSLDVSSNPNLTELDCSINASLTNLTIEGATELTYLSCDNTGIGSLDVSSNEKLNLLYCNNTGIRSLDVSSNKKLTVLDCSNNPLAYLNIGKNNELIYLSSTGLKPVEVTVTSDSFNMADKFAGIDADAVRNVKNATYNSGTMSNYSEGTPIQYTYHCGTSSRGEQTIKVTLNITLGSTIDITENLDKTYDGTAVSAAPEVSRKGSSGKVSYKWEREKGANTWEIINSAPTDAGTYQVTATLESDGIYKGITSEPVQFTIAKAASSISIIADLNKAYDGKAVSAKPEVDRKGSSGGVSYKWEREKSANTWEIINSAPTDAGTYQVTATLASDNNYEEKTSEPVQFTISRAANGWTGPISITGWTYGKSPNDPTAAAKFGKASYLYSNREHGNYTDTVPSHAGRWYVKAVVAGTNNYEGLESDAVSFVIAPKDITTDHQILVPDITADTDLDELVIQDGDRALVQGTDYDVTTKRDGANVTVAITGKGNYTGTITRTYTVEEKAPSGGVKDSDNNKPDGTKTDKKAAQTGDPTNVGVFAAMILLSAGCMFVLIRKKGQKK